ncbi:hypothetical protein ACQ86N_19390 [Puia sp. P3]|uniref:hypothetical protein n=1 Tax=Puia sp. P3 TaxID=3423952 RepID=UPI003D66E806
MTSKAQNKLQTGEKPFRVYVYPNVGRQLMGSNNPYVQHLKEAIGLHELDIDEATTDKAFPDFLRKGLRADMVVLNWLENLPLRRMGVLQSLVVLFYLRLLKIRGTRIVWIKHNKGTHSRKWFGLSKMIQRALIRSADHIVTHSMDTDIPDTGKLHYLPHPSNIGPEAIIRPEPAEPAIDLLIWGSMMPYKGVLEFLRHAAGDRQLSQLNIHVAGKKLRRILATAAAARGAQHYPGQPLYQRRRAGAALQKNTVHPVHLQQAVGHVLRRPGRQPRRMPEDHRAQCRRLCRHGPTILLCLPI